ncbi:BOLA class I histocompatibility antigen, alpha chain BL3-6-like isoform X1 [Pantherophis guttatus]|uniref:BOLA class I histocompatibility antigen, alpha chain BL3-6-like isoform X1 n=1 Tax=Pantherophis guttatus TaxID=94885 RepID=A0ABM3YZW2_PANGU|nr:BOLA class I histocompatibility antigen, alpha chain BL3-6-like isoform X1 [Pantherophis guttatus]
MALRSAPFLLLVLVAVALRESCFGFSSHSLKYFSTAISKPSQGLPQYITLGFVDSQVFLHYDCKSRKMQPRVSWIEKVGKEDPQYWDRKTHRERGHEEAFRNHLEFLRTLYNQSEDFHTFQLMSGCELRGDGSKGGFEQYGYDGRTFVTFDKETLTWVAPDPQAQITKRKWDAIPGWNQGRKAYLEGECIEWLRRYLSYGKETLLRTDPPVVTVTRRTEAKDGMETHICRMDNFYPREIDASWTRDGEVWLQDTLHGSVVPNADGTYHYWLSIQIDPKERGRYRCHVEHDGLQEPLDVAIKESNLALIIGCIVAALALVCVIVGTLIFFSASSHSMKYFYTGISEPTQGLPHFVALGFVDDQLFSYYDSHSQKLQARVSWMEKVRKEDPQYWDRNTRNFRGTEEVFREGLEILRSRYNQSEGLHTWQNMYGCELRGDGSKGGFDQYGYEGRTFITFDKETLTWVAPVPQAQITQRKWDADPGMTQGNKAYLEKICIEWLEKHLSYGNETLLRRETPKVTVSSRTEVEDGMETHVCRVHGFYPREIDASWTRDGEVWLQDTLHASVAPNADGTYHDWIGIRISAKERDRYRCHVDHDSLQEPLDLELKEPTNSKSNLGLIIGCVVAALLLVCPIVGILVFFNIRQDGYQATPRDAPSRKKEE